MLLRFLLRRAAAAPRPAPRLYSAKSKTKSKSNPTASNKSKSNPAPPNKSKPRRAAAAAADDSAAAPSSDDLDDHFDLPTSPLPPSYDPALDVGPNNRPLFTITPSLASLTAAHVNTYFDFTVDGLKEMIPEGLPTGMVKEFEEVRRCAVMIRQGFLDLRDNFRRVVDPPMPLRGDKKGPKVKKQIVLDGPVSCGKSIALAMLVHWARSEGWLVFYVPRGKEWTHGGFFYRNPYDDLWDTPAQAKNVLQDFLKYNESRLKELVCQIFDPIPLGEGIGCGMMKGVDSMAIPEGSSLFDLIQTGVTYTHAAVGVLVRLRKELSLVKDVPVLFAIDQYNNWFTFSGYEEAATSLSTRSIHAKKLTTVNAFRSMMHGDMMVGAFTHSTAVGKLRQQLPDVPSDARVMLPRYTLDEAATVSHYYLRQKLVKPKNFTEERWKKIYYLANGNGAEMRWLAPFI